MINLQKN